MSAIFRAMLSPFRSSTSGPTPSAFSWRYIVPRIVLMLAVVLTIDYGLGYLVKNHTKKSLESFLGAPVEVATARAYLVSNQVLMGGVSIVDPARPSEKLAEAERCQIDFASNPLLQQSTPIAACTFTGLKFDPAKLNAAGNKIAFQDDSNELAARWLTQLESRLQQDFIAELPSVQASRVLEERMSAEREKHDVKLQQLERMITKLQQAAEDAAKNPLRYDSVQRDTQSKLTAMRGDFDELNKCISSLSGALEADRRSVVAARAQDEAHLRERLSMQPIEAAAFNAYLLRDQAPATVEALLGWFRWMRGIATPAANNIATGDNDVLIRALHLQGTTELAGQPVQFRGTVTNLASSLKKPVEPIQLRFATTSSNPIEIVATLDRRGAEPCDELTVNCPHWQVPELKLGRANQLTLDMAPGSGRLSVNLRAIGDKLDGEINLDHTDALVTPHVSDGLTALPLVALGNMNAISTKVVVRGTIQSPTCKLESTLSPALAKALDESLKTAIDGRVQTVLATARQRVDERLAELDRQITNEQQALLARLKSVASDVEHIAKTQTPRDRISIERIGHRMPESSRFR